MALSRRLTAEFFGTFWLVFGGCGSAVLAAAFPALGIGFAGVALAFGLTVLTMVYALGPISGGHFNPAVTVGLWCAKRFAAKDVLPYIIVQVVGAIAAAAVLLRHRKRQRRFLTQRRIRKQRLRRTFARPILDGRRARRASSCSPSDSLR